MSTGAFWQAIRERDKSFEGKFVFAVLTTGVFCRPGCPSRTPKPENVRLFSNCQEAESAGFRPCLRCRPKNASSEDVEAMCAWIREHSDEPITLAKLGGAFQMSEFHLQRKFKAAVGITPRQYAEQQRMQRLKSSLREGGTVTQAIYEAGFGSSSRVYERTSSHLGMTPRAYRNGGKAQNIRYGIWPSAIGLLLVAATDAGICSIQIGDSQEELVRNLRTEFPNAALVAGDADLEPHHAQLADWLAGQRVALDLPLDVQATAFQRSVWNYLRQIPYGLTRTYSEIARDMGTPSATRAIARACATNPVAIAIPCHRVIRQSGEMAGYRWGVDRKRKLLDLEKKGEANPAR